METAIYTVLLFALGYAGWRVITLSLSALFYYLARQEIEKHGIDAIEDPELREFARQIFQIEKPAPAIRNMSIKIDCEQGVLIAYKLDNEQFLASGSSERELLENLKMRFKNDPAINLQVCVENGGHYLPSLMPTKD